MPRKLLVAACPNRFLRAILLVTLSLVALYCLLYVTYPEHALSAIPPYFKKPPSVSIWDSRATAVKAAFLHAYHNYEKYAAPHDELRPLSNGSIDNFNGWGVTPVDSLDTMLLMGLTTEYSRALKVVEKIDFSKSSGYTIPFFETVIRYLGGLLSAYALSKDPILLARADNLALNLAPAFNTTSGLPYFGVDVKRKQPFGGASGSLAEIGTLQLEYSYLAKATGKKEHYDRSASVMKAFTTANLRATGGMLPTQWNLMDGQPIDNHLSVGAMADSAHEYLLKLYLLTSKTDKASLELYIKATTHIITHLIYLSPTRHLLYATDTQSWSTREGTPSHTYEHLSCFLPGLFALGAHILPLDNLKSMGIDLKELGNTTDYLSSYEQVAGYNLKDLHLWAAEGLTETCWLMYADEPSGISPDEVSFHSGYGSKTKPSLWMDTMQQWKASGGRGSIPGLSRHDPIVHTEAEYNAGNTTDRDYNLKRTEYFLRPETLESIYLMYKTTGDEKWRQRGWDIFEALERETKTPFGYANLAGVQKTPATQTDGMPSYFLAETLKYLYLLFTSSDPMDLNKWVFNTEAHPLPVFSWTPEEILKFNITM